MEDKLLKLQQDYGHVKLFSVSGKEIVDSIDIRTNYFFTEELTEVCIAIESNDIANLTEEIADMQITCELLCARYGIPDSIKEELPFTQLNIKLGLMELVKTNIKIMRKYKDIEEVEWLLRKAYAIYHRILKDYNLNTLKVREWYEAKRRRIIYNYTTGNLV